MASPDTDGFVYLYISLVTWVNVKYSLKPEGKVPMQIYIVTRFIPVHNVVCKLNEEQTNILLSEYALTGCDTCCALFGIGKKKKKL